jgi:N-acetylglutamate synthase-like GNAT family acetyltransferase
MSKCEIDKGKIMRRKAFFEFNAYNKDGKIIGTADVTLLKTDKKFMWLHELSVPDPKCRGKGIGSEIIQAIADAGREEKAELVYAYPMMPMGEAHPIPQKKIEHFYKENGFVPCNAPKDVSTITDEGLFKRGVCLRL